MLDRVKRLFKEPPAKLTPTEQAEVLREVLTEKLADVPRGHKPFCTACGQPMGKYEGSYYGSGGSRQYFDPDTGRPAVEYYTWWACTSHNLTHPEYKLSGPYTRWA